MAYRKKHQKRLQRVYDLLEFVPEERLAMECWQEACFEASYSSCGTAACAIGWATEDLP